MNFFTAYPEPDELLTTYALHFGDDIPSVNGHIHSPFSFSAFDNLEQAFRMALSENVDVLGLNDFYVADGYPDFARLAKNIIFSRCLTSNALVYLNLNKKGNTHKRSQ